MRAVLSGPVAPRPVRVPAGGLSRLQVEALTSGLDGGGSSRVVRRLSSGRSRRMLLDGDPS